MISKVSLRSEARARRTELAAAQAGFARKIARYADALPLDSGASVASYWPLREEADPRALAAALAQRGHPILLPAIAGAAAPLVFRRWNDGDPVETNVFGIGEPLSTAEAQHPAIVLVPLLAFDARGHRLGYGGGYYDRSLAQLRATGHVLAVGVAYAGQERGEIPQGPHDEKLDMLVTERGVRRFDRRRS